MFNQGLTPELFEVQIASLAAEFRRFGDVGFRAYFGSLNHGGCALIGLPECEQMQRSISRRSIAKQKKGDLDED